MIEMIHRHLNGARRRLPHEINTSHRLILAGPTPFRGGATQKCGAKPPALIFVCPSPTRVGAAEDEVKEVMISWGNETPHLPDYLPRRYLHQLICLSLFFCLNAFFVVYESNYIISGDVFLDLLRSIGMFSRRPLSISSKILSLKIHPSRWNSLRRPGFPEWHVGDQDGAAVNGLFVAAERRPTQPSRKTMEAMG